MDVIAYKIHTLRPVDNRPTLSPSNPLRIAFCLPELKPFQQVMRGEPGDAAYIQQKYIATGLSARGHSLTFAAPHNLSEMGCTRDLQQSGFAPRTWSASRWFDLAGKGIWRVQRWLGLPYLNVFSNYRFFDACLQCLPGHDVVHERNGLYNAGVAMACRRLKLPYVLFFDADQIMEHDFMGRPITGLLRWRAQQLLSYNLKAADAIICVSEPARNNLISNWSVPAEKIVVFSNGVDVQRFWPDPEARSQVRASLGINNSPLFVFVGNFYQWHDVSTLLAAFAQVLGSYPDVRLILVGDGPQRQTMMQQVAEAGLARAVQFTGLVAHAEVPRLMAAADVAVAPVPPMSHDLWLSPMKLFEYMACGTAVVASTVGQLVEVVQNGHNGLLVPPGDAPALASALEKLIADATLRTQLGQQARKDAVQKYSWEQYLSRLERVYAAVIAGRPVNLI
jgi:glycosyltransferase involved in cell wall biosynthesis